MSTKISRREFVAVTLQGLPVIAVLGNFRNQTQRKKKLIVAVLEHVESKTSHAVGAERMLQRAGFDVIKLVSEPAGNDISVGSMVTNYRDKTHKARIQQRIENPTHEFPLEPSVVEIDMIFFGTFANQGQPYHDFLRRYSHEIPAFVAAGGVVVEMCQWARYAFLSPAYLPESMKLVRESWSGSDEITVVDRNHPLITRWLGGQKERMDYPKQWPDPARKYDRRRSWESFAVWEGMRVLLGAGGGYRQQSGVPGRAALVEGEHGKGRYLFSGLWLDKLFDKEGNALGEPETMKTGIRFFNALYGYASMVRAGKSPSLLPTPMPPEPVIGPMLGHIDDESAVLWIRGNQAGIYHLRVWEKEGGRESERRLSQSVTAANDYCLHWRLLELAADRTYCYQFEYADKPLFGEQLFEFKTSPRPDTPAKWTLAFGSCVDQDGHFEDVWKKIADSGADGMVLLGDTPYIDTTVEEQQRIKHRTFLLQEGPAFLAQRIPFWGTWDDHDLGANNSNGNIHNRERTRQVFLDYRALAGYGESGEGIYTAFRNGPLEVFLLDTRYFARTAPSFCAPDQPTMLGLRQWEWLKAGLRSSTAPVKVLACGMTWDSKSGGKEADDWETFAYEREAIIDFIGANNIPGVVLVGGDIHCTQVMKYPTESRIGYPLYHIVTSPMHDRLIKEQEKEPDGKILFARALPHTFLKLTADTLNKPLELNAEIINMEGECLYRLTLTEEALNPSNN